VSEHRNKKVGNMCDWVNGEWVGDLKRKRKLTVVEVILLGDLLVEINAAWFSNSKNC
jgi:hypothetical protein